MWTPINKCEGSVFLDWMGTPSRSTLAKTLFCGTGYGVSSALGAGSGHPQDPETVLPLV